MCKMRNLTENIRVATIKYDYIINIIKQTQKCKNISKIILFGSSIEERCQQKSDIDIAVFGEKKANFLFKISRVPQFQ